MKVLCSTLCLLLATAAGSVAANDRFDDSVRAVATGASPLKIAEDRGFAVRDGRIQVVAIVADGDPAEVGEWLSTHGALFVVAARDRVQAFVPPELLPALQQQPGVVFIERPIYAEVPEPTPPAAALKQTTLAVTSEGVAVMNAPAWQAQGFTGAGVKVGVIDAEFGGWEDLLGVELPPADRTTYQAFGGTSVSADRVHGTACAEIVHDIAPDAELFLAHIRTTTDFYAALDWLEGYGVDVVTMSLGWTGSSPGDGTGQAANAITAFVAATDAVFATSAGNERQAHWQGQTIDGDGNGWVDFVAGDDLNELSSTMSAGDKVGVSIVWNDWSAPTTDYSLHLYNLDGAEPVEVAVSDRPQSGQGWQTPTERIDYTTPDGGRFGVRIGRVEVAGSNDLELFSSDSDVSNRVGEGSLTLPADSFDTIAVAAVNYNAPYGVRNFSSAGPTNGPGGSLTGGVTKPDLSGYDGVSTASYGPRNFYGTSAASPHVAGAAAVVRSAEPGFNSDETRTFLADRALDLGQPGMDDDYGSGRVFLGQTPGSDCTFMIDPASAAAPAAGGGGIIHVTTAEGCPWTASSHNDWLNVAPTSGSGSGIVGYTVDANPGAALRTGSITVAGRSFAVTQSGAVSQMMTYMVAGIAETEGLQQTRWKSDLAILNPGTDPAEVDLRYRHAGGLAQSSLSLESGAILELVNVAVDTFGEPDSAGAVEVMSDRPLIVTARTYNDAPQGTFGQFIPGVASSDGLAPGEVATVSQLNSNDHARTNVGCVDLAGNGAAVRIRLFDGSGAAVGDEMTETIPAGGWFQRSRVFRAAGAGDCSGCYALVDVIGDGGPVWVYASVVDNESGDPTTIPMAKANPAKTTGDERYLVAGIAETDGANQTKWKSNLALLNLSGQGVTADLSYRHAGGSEGSSLTLADGELREFANIVGDLFAAPGSSGAVEVGADGPLVVTARTFNDSPDGTFGQFLPGLGTSEALTPGDGGYLSQLKSTDDFRTNIGFTNFGESECSVRVFLHDDQGERMGVLYAAVPAGGWTQINRVFEASAAGSCPLGYAFVEVLTGGCQVWAYASVVDNGSGDPTTLPMVIR